MEVLRSVAAVVVSYGVVFVLVLLSDPLLTDLYPGLQVRGQVRPAFMLRMSTWAFVVAAILGGAICVRTAPSRPSRHLFWLFILGEMMGLVTTIMNWNKGWPHWHSLVWLAVWPVSLFPGGLAKKRQDAKKAAATAAA